MAIRCAIIQPPSRAPQVVGRGTSVPTAAPRLMSSRQSPRSWCRPAHPSTGGGNGSHGGGTGSVTFGGGWDVPDPPPTPVPPAPTITHHKECKGVRMGKGILRRGSVNQSAVWGGGVRSISVPDGVPVASTAVGHDPAAASRHPESQPGARRV